MSDDKTLTHEAIVIERCGNGVIIRPHRAYWERGGDGLFQIEEVRVFENFGSLVEYLQPWFPKIR